MRKYLLRFEERGTVGPDDFEEAQEYFQKVLGRINHYVRSEGETKHFSIFLVDIQQLPREWGDSTQRGDEDLLNDQAVRDDPDLYEAHVFPDAQVVHPWDQGLWIFPEDHPLRGAEEAVRFSDTKSPGEKREIGQALLALPLGKEEQNES